MKRGCSAFILLMACGPVVDGSGDASSGDTTSASTSASTTTSPSSSVSAATSSPPTDDTAPPDPSVPTDPSDTTTPSEETALPGVPDAGGVPFECSIWEQDCPKGDKCMPWANDGGSSWNAARCSPLDANPHDVGESCTVEGNGVSGIDDCVLGAMCFYVDETNEGECIAFCEGNEADPTCDDACTYCNITGEGILTLCLPSCDPVAQDCDPGNACYPTSTRFTCAPDAGGNEGAIGTPCEFVNVCDPGLFCADPTLLPTCEGMTGCCTPFCDADEPDSCDGQYEGTVCVPWWDEGEEPEEACLESGTVGGCLLPQ